MKEITILDYSELLFDIDNVDWNEVEKSIDKINVFNSEVKKHEKTIKDAFNSPEAQRDIGRRLALAMSIEDSGANYEEVIKRTKEGENADDFNINIDGSYKIKKNKVAYETTQDIIDEINRVQDKK